MYGGIYLDFDEILLRPVDNLRVYEHTQVTYYKCITNGHIDVENAIHLLSYLIVWKERTNKHNFYITLKMLTPSNYVV